MTKTIRSHTPAGARLAITRYRRTTVIDIDRWPIEDAPPEIAETANYVTWAAMLSCRAEGIKPETGNGSGRVVWRAMIPSPDEEQALGALLALENGDAEPARTYIREALERARAAGKRGDLVQRVHAWLGKGTRRSAPIVKVSPNPDDPDYYVVTVDCPICGNHHWHGVGRAEKPGGGYGHRAPHCAGSFVNDDRTLTYGGYYLTDPGGMVEAANLALEVTR